MNRFLLKISILAAIISMVTTEAHAYKLYRTDNGNLVRWHRSEVVVLLDPSLAQLGPMEAVATSISQAFRLWNDLADVPVAFVFKRQPCADSGNGRDNCIMADAGAHPDRQADGGGQGEEAEGATAYLDVLPSTGEIQSAKIVFNTSDWCWDSASASPEALNLARVSSHEVGHFLGIDHSAQPTALMYGFMSRFDRSAPQLHEDDQLAATALYESFTEDDVTASDCSVTAVAAGRSSNASFVFLYLVAAMLLWRYRRAHR